MKTNGMKQKQKFRNKKLYTFKVLVCSRSYIGIIFVLFLHNNNWNNNQVQTVKGLRISNKFKPEIRVNILFWQKKVLL